MVGDSSCGKTSLVLRFDQNVFSTKFVTTIGVDYRDKVVKVSWSVNFAYAVSRHLLIHLSSISLGRGRSNASATLGYRWSRAVPLIDF